MNKIKEIKVNSISGEYNSIPNCQFGGTLKIWLQKLVLLDRMGKVAKDILTFECVRCGKLHEFHCNINSFYWDGYVACPFCSAGELYFDKEVHKVRCPICGCHGDN